MKKAIVAGLLAICVIAISQQQASAWVNSRFGVGLNWSRQSGGNSIAWGAWRNGQPPGPEAMHHGHSFPQYGHVAPEGFGPFSQAPVEAPAYTPAQPSVVYPSPYQFATYPRPVYYYPTPSFYYYQR